MLFEMNKILVLLAVVSCITSKPTVLVTDEPVCGYASCHPVNESMINVHIIPHSHDDVGWLKTVDQYYYNEVQQILSSVVIALREDPARRFIQVETAFFYMWWNQQNKEVQAQVQQLVNEGRLEIVNGAWSMNDEAAVHYQSTIDQFTLGLKFLEDNLGRCARPKTSWQIDTFGHSREHASLVSQFGMDGLFFARFDYRDRAKRLDEKTMDMLWTGSANLGSDSNVFTSALYRHYSPPPKFCFDIVCQDEPIVTDEDSFEYNWERRVNEFADFVKEQSEQYLTNNIVITMGDDFQYQAASSYYNNIDKLIEGFKKFNPKINGKEANLIYSTPACYTKAVHDYVQDNKIQLDVKTDDFLPYADEPPRVWTGYFTSRPQSKKLERISNNILQVSKQLSALVGKPYESNAALSQALGVMQHHDAITGTETDEVERDYHRQLSQGIEKSTGEVGNAFSAILGLPGDLNLTSCTRLNVSVCALTKKDEYNLVIYNPLARAVSHYVQVPADRYGKYEVQGPDGVVVENRVTDLIDYFGEVPDRVEGTLIFKAEDLPPLGYKVYKIKKLSNEEKQIKTNIKEAVDRLGFEDKYVSFDTTTGELKSITIFGRTLEVTQKFYYYSSSDVSNPWIFKPEDEKIGAIELPLNSNTDVLVNDGDLVREIRQRFDFGISTIIQIIRIYKDEDFIEFDWLIAPVQISKGGKEIVTRYTAKMVDPNDEFFTDANGREMIRRKKNYRPTYDYTDEEPQSGNYYPVNTRMMVKNDSYEFAVLTDRSQGGTSLEPGQIELMVARQVVNGLNENEFDTPLKVRGSHYITHGVSANGDGTRSMAAIERDIALRKLLQPWLFFTLDDVNVKEQSFLSKELPSNVHLLTLDSWNSTGNTILIRLEHVLEQDEDPELSKQVTVDLTGLFKPFTIKTMKEYTLAANIPLEESERLEWAQLEAVDESSILSKQKRLSRKETDLGITLEPMQIRTFIATVEFV